MAFFPALAFVLWASLASAQDDLLLKRLSKQSVAASVTAALTLGQDCPVKHLALTALDHASMEAAYVASFRGLYHRDPTGAPGSGPDDTAYWIGSYDHYGEYSDNVCRAGWNAYTETRLSGLASADPALGDQPARFRPGNNNNNNNSQPPPPPAPPPALAGPLAIDYTPLLQQLLASQQQLLAAQGDLLVVAKDTNAQVSQINKTFAQTLGQAAAFLGKYVSPAVLAWIAAKKL